MLLGAVAYAGALVDGGTGTTDHAVDTALDRATTTARTSVSVAADRAVRRGARRPLATTANTTAGAAVNDSRPFASGLELRIGLAVARSLGRTTVGRVVVESGLPPLDDDPSAAAAVRRVDVRPTADETGVVVTVHGVTHTARRVDGLGSTVVDRTGESASTSARDAGSGRSSAADHVLATRTTTLTVVVDRPAFAVHRRVQRYDRRLSRGPTEGVGLGRQLTGAVTALAAARGLAQYGGAGVENVVGTRHVSLATNGGALRLQRATFGRADPDGRSALRRASVRTGLTDLLSGARTGTTRGSWAHRVLGAGTRAAGRVPVLAEGRRNTRRRRVAVNATAEDAYLETLAELDTLRRQAYTATVTRRVRVRDSDRASHPTTDPGPNWTLVASETTTDTTIRDRETHDSPDSRRFLAATRVVAVRHERTRRWVDGNESRHTHATWTDRHTVRIGARGRYAPSLPGPDRRVRQPFAPSDTLDGANLVGVPAAAGLPPSEARLDDLARRAVRTGGWRDRESVAGSSPPTLRAWLLADLIDLRERLRAVDVSVRHAAIADGTATPAARLASELRERREAFVDAPATYDGVADRLRVAARARLVTAVIESLEARADRRGDRERPLADAFEGVITGGAEAVRAASDAAADAVAPRRRAIGPGPGGRIVLVPDADPAYLTTTPVDGALTRSVPVGEDVTPLATRNVNAFTVPFDDAGDVLSGWLPGGTSRRVSLATAGRALATANDTLASDRLRPANETRERAGPGSRQELRERRDDLAAAVGAGLRPVDRRLVDTLAETLSDRLDRREARSLVSTAAERYDGEGARALAVANGSFATVVSRVATRRLRLSTVERDTVTVRLRAASRRARSDETVHVPAASVNATVGARRQAVEAAAKRLATDGSETALQRARERLARDAFDGVLAGVPVAPVPGYWYATANVWAIQVRGEYAQFAVTARRGGENGSAALRYVREDAVVRLDTDGDGVRERVGRSRAVSFRTRAVAFAVVPPGRSGVGDVDGNADERSSAWACPSGPACNENESASLHAPDAVADAHPLPAVSRRCGRRAATRRSSRAARRDRAATAASAPRPGDSRRVGHLDHRRHPSEAARRTGPG